MRPILLVCTALLFSACQAPRVITSMTATDTQMKMVYSQAGGARTGTAVPAQVDPCCVEALAE